MKVKVCGNTNVDQVFQLDEIGVHYAGFIFYEKSPRYVIGRIKESELKRADLGLKKVGVFVNADYEEVMKQKDKFGLQVIQLHGDESPELSSRISKEVLTIKVFRVNSGNGIDEKLKEFEGVVDFFLFDKEDKRYGGTGQKFNWKVLSLLSVHQPFFLSGGIGLEDVKEIKQLQMESIGRWMYGVDVNSRFEIEPGLKEMDKVKRFLKKIA